MSVAAFHHRWRGSPLTRRITSFALALGAHALVALLLLMLVPKRTPPPEADTPLSTFDVSPAPTPAVKAVPRAAASTSNATPEPAPPTPTTPVLPPLPSPAPAPAPSPPDTNMLDFDLAKLPTRGRGSGKTVASDSGPAYGPGEGPGGQRLFNAEWQREPTDAELGTYLPADMPRPAWAMIACRTVEDYHVENCRQLGEYPLGSGLARAMRLAAWQFRVLPPRVGTKTMIGAWVRIRIDFTTAGTDTP